MHWGEKYDNKQQLGCLCFVAFECDKFYGEKESREEKEALQAWEGGIQFQIGRQHFTEKVIQTTDGGKMLSVVIWGTSIPNRQKAN